MRNVKAPSNRIPSLDGLRGLSIWAVMLAHASSHFKQSPLHGRYAHTFLAGLAYFGVTTFFVISGFLITSLLLKERERSSTISLSRFYQRRAVRILPAFLLYAGTVAVVGHPTFVQAVYAFTFTTSYAFAQAYLPLQQLWSLSVEEQFYLLWPLLMLCGPRMARRSCWLVVLGCPLLRVLLKHAGYAGYSHLAPAIMDSIAAGCLLAFYEDEVRTFAAHYLRSTGRFLALALGTMCFAELAYHFDVVLLWGIVPVLLTLVIAAAIERRDHLLNSGPLVWSGLLSYSLYLWQQPFLVLDGPLNFPWFRVPLTFAAAFLSYRFVEQPVLSFFSRPARRRAEWPAVPAVVHDT